MTHAGATPARQVRTILTMSWDDGHPNDVRVAELMAKYGIKGTFYVPIVNQEGLPVMSLAEMREVAMLHEMGSHTYSHCYLNSVPTARASLEISSGKAALEEMLGKPVSGFCYPGGKFRPAHVSMVRESGFGYARGNVSCRTDLHFDRFSMPTTLQVYPHRRTVYLRNFLSQGDWRRRAALLPRLLTSNQLLDRLLACFDVARACRCDTVVHFWGHSWELDISGGWSLLETLFQHVQSQPDIIVLENRDVVASAIN